MQIKAVVYARYSSEKQTEQSIEGQLHVCQEYADKNNLNIIDTYIDRAKTGRNDNRQEFQQMMKDSSSGKFNVILVYALDRFSRNRYDSAINKATLRRNNVRLISVTQPISDNPEGILLESVLEGMAEYYSVELAQKLARGRRESVEKGNFTGGVVKYGYKIENKKYVIEPEEAKTVQQIYKLFIEFRNYRDVLKYLKDNCILNRQRKPFKRHQLRNILSNEIYTGLLVVGEYKCENATPIIIEKTQFDEVQNIMNTNLRSVSKSDANFLLTGKLICGECGENINGDSGKSKTGKMHYYYTCNNKKSNKGCTLHSFPKEKLEKQIFDAVKKELLSPTFVGYIVDKISDLLHNDDTDDRIKVLSNDLISIDKKMENIVKAIENGIINDKIKQQNDELVNQRELIEQELYSLKNNPLQNLTKEDIEKYIVKKYTKDCKDSIISDLVYKVYVYEHELVILLNIFDGGDTSKRRKLNISNDRKSSRKCPIGPPLLLYSNSYREIIVNSNNVLYVFKVDTEIKKIQSS